MVENLLADADALGGDLQKLVVAEEFEGFLEGEAARRDEAERVIRTGGAGVGELLFLADVDGDVLVLGG